MTTQLLAKRLFLLCSISFCWSFPAAKADVPPLLEPGLKIVTFGLQAVRTQAGPSMSVSAADVFAGPRMLSNLSVANQAFVRDQFLKYAKNRRGSEEDTVLHSAAMASVVVGQRGYAQDPEVSFGLYPYMKLVPSIAGQHSSKTNFTALGQPISLNSLGFSRFIDSFTPEQRVKVVHSGSLLVSDFSPRQRLFISHLWTLSSHPECRALCSQSNTQVTVGFYLESTLTQRYQDGSVTYELQLPQSGDGHTPFPFGAVRHSQEGQVWIEF